MNLRIAFGFALTALALNTFAQDFVSAPSTATQIAEESSQRPLGQLIKQQQQRLQEHTLAEESSLRPLGQIIKQQQQQRQLQEHRVAEESSLRPLGQVIEDQQQRLDSDEVAENGSAQTLDRLIKAGQTRQA
ncbi:hypothetical protein [Pseudomonas sp. Marseille-Q7302]